MKKKEKRARALGRRPRFEEQVTIVLTCCSLEMILRGNLSLRGTSKATSLGYECTKCFRRVMVVDQWTAPTKEIDMLHDIEE